MEHSTDEDPGLAVMADQRQARLADFVLEQLCEAAKDFMRVKQSIRSRTRQLALTPNTPASRFGFGRRTAPTPIIKEVWHVGVLLHEDSLPMAIYIGIDGTPYCAYYLRGVGEQRVEITEALLLGFPSVMLEDMVTTIQEKRSTLKLTTPVG